MFAVGHSPHITLELLRRKAARRLAQEADRSETVDRDVEEPVMKDGSAPGVVSMIHFRGLLKWAYPLFMAFIFRPVYNGKSQTKNG